MEMSDDFVDYYDVLQLSPAAEPDTIQRVFRLLAQRYHPDNAATGNEAIFQQLLRAYDILHDPVKRAAYDARHRAHRRATMEVFDKHTAPGGQLAERKKREGVLGALYRKRQHSPNRPGMNLRELEDVLGIPKEHLEFAMWFLKEKGDIKSGDNGMYIMSIQGALSYEAMTMSAETEDRNVYLLPAPDDAERVA